MIYDLSELNFILSRRDQKLYINVRDILIEIPMEMIKFAHSIMFVTEV